MLVALLLVAAAFRFYALPDLPLGLDQDEIINAIAIRGILAGERPIFITAGWGREPVYAYAAAFVVSLTGDMVMGMRVTTVAFSMLFLAVAYVTARRLFNRSVALMTLGWLAVSFWPLMTSRAGERNIMLAFSTTLTIYLFHRALQSNLQSPTSNLKLEIRDWRFGMAGIALGATLWTYQSARVMPLAFLLFAAYLAYTQRARFRQNWKGILLFLIVGGLIASPLLLYLATHPNAEVGDFKTQSLQVLQQGNWQPMLSAALGTLGLFTVRGEIYWLHNIPGRPILDWISGVLFYLGLIVAVARWRRPEYALTLLWLIVGLGPAMITDPPSHHRMANVMAAAYLLPALGAEWIGHNLARFAPAASLRARFHPFGFAQGKVSRRTVCALALVALLAWTGYNTARDFFSTWAVSIDVQDLHFAKLAQLSRDLDRDPDTSPVVVTGTYIEDIEPLVPAALMKRQDLEFRWQAMAGVQVIPPGSQARYYDPGSGLRAVNTDLTRRDLVARAAASPEVWLAPPGDALPATVGMPADLPISFGGQVEFLGAEIAPPSIVTFWRVLHDGSPSSTAMFLHLTTLDQKIIAQDDRLGFPTHSWRTGDMFTQSFILNVPANLAGPVWLEIGIYDRQTLKRWQVTSAPGVNRALLRWSAIR